MTTPLMHLPWDSCLLEPVRDREIEAWLKREVGAVPGWTRYFWSSRWFAKSMITLQYDQRLMAALDSNLAWRVALVISQENSCRYCYAMVRIMLRLFGLNESSMQELERQIAESRDLSPKLQAALHFARMVNRGNPLNGPAERAALKQAGFTANEIRELAFLVVSMGVTNRLATAVALTPQFLEAISSHWVVGLIQPIASRMLKRLRKPALPNSNSLGAPPLVPALVTAYEGSPIARVLAESLAQLWREQVVSPRHKLLIMATVGQGISCSVCRAEVTRLAAEEGLDAEVLYTSAAHLDDPALTQAERAMLEFARESLWYEPQKLQRRARALLEAVGTDRFVEMLAVVTLANMFTRLTATMVEAT